MLGKARVVCPRALRLFFLGIRVRRMVYARLVPGFGIWVRHMSAHADVLCDARYACEVVVVEPNRGRELGFWVCVSALVSALKQQAVAGDMLDLVLQDGGRLSVVFSNGSVVPVPSSEDAPAIYPGDSVRVQPGGQTGVVVHVDARARAADLRLSENGRVKTFPMRDLAHAGAKTAPPLFPDVKVCCVALVSVALLREFQKRARSAGQNVARVTAVRRANNLLTSGPGSQAHELEVLLAWPGSKDKEPAPLPVGRADVYLDNLTRFLQHMDADADVEIGLGAPQQKAPMVLTNYVKDHLSFVRHVVVPYA